MERLGQWCPVSGMFIERRAVRAADVEEPTSTLPTLPPLDQFDFFDPVQQVLPLESWWPK